MGRLLLRLLAVVPIVGAFAVVGSVTRIGPLAVGCAAAAATHHAALVVEHGDGAVLSECVAFTEDQVSGEQLLQYAQQQHGGAPEYATADFGSNGKAVCQIDHEPSSYPASCWTASSPYWALFVSRGGGGWLSSSRGISSQTFGDGDAEGFRYEGQSDQSTPPSPSGVCPPPAPPPSATTGAPSPAPSPRSPAASTGSHAPGSSAAAPSQSGAAVAAAPSTAHATAPSTDTTSQAPTSPSSSSSSALSSSQTARASGSHVASSVPATTPLPPGGFPAGAVAAMLLGLVLLGMLGVQLLRARRRPPPPPA